MKERNNIHICHFTSVHNPDDIRIFKKECVSLAKAGYKVSLVAPGLISEMKDGVNVIAVGNRPANRLERIFCYSKSIAEKARRIDADIYHFHDPELLQYAWGFIRDGKKVIYDSHEDVPKQIFGKYWIKPFLRFIISIIFRFYENTIVTRLTGVVTATPFIESRYKTIHNNTININNFPFLEEFMRDNKIIQRENTICYVGGITEVRCAKEMVRAMAYVENIKLLLAGNIVPESLLVELMKEDGWKNVEYIGLANRKVVAEILSKCKAGLVLMYPLPNHVDAQPNKMFEYMSASLPVIASDFDLWKEVVEGNNAGICVDPMNTDAIADSIKKICASEQDIVRMGNNGRNCVLNKYNWEAEEKILIRFYDKISKIEK